MRLAMLAFASAALLVMASGAGAAPVRSWNGTWVGNWDKGGNGTQIVFAGETFISIYWNGDYVSDAEGTVSKDGSTVTITWTGAKAVLTRDGDATAHILIQEKGKPDVRFAVKKDS